MDKRYRYVVNTDTGRIWNEVCDTYDPHINGIGVSIARALPDMAALLAELLNERETALKERALIASQLELMGFDGAARFVRALNRAQTE